MALRSATASDYWFTALVLAAFGAGIIIAVLNLPAGIVIVTVTAMLAALVYWHAKTHGYRCGNCSAEFTISAWQDLTSPHTPARKYVLCPSCGERTWAQVLVQS